MFIKFGKLKSIPTPSDDVLKAWYGYAYRMILGWSTKQLVFSICYRFEDYYK